MIAIDQVHLRFEDPLFVDDACFWSRAGRGYRDGLARLDALPRDDPFWSGQNHKATQYKLAKHCSLLVERDPFDRRARWSQLGLDVSHCSNSLTEPAWRTLLDLGDFRPHWLIEHAYWVRAVSGADTFDHLVNLLRTHGVTEAVYAPELDVERSEPDFGSWVVALGRELHG